MASLRSVVPVRAGLVFFLKLPTISARRRISLSVVALLFSVTMTPAVSAATPPPLWECKAGYGLTVTVAAGLQSPNECVEPLKVYLKDNFVPFFCAFPGMTGYQVINIWLDEIQPVGTKVVWYEFGVGMLISHPGSDRPFGCSETGAGGRAQVQECPINPLPNPIIPRADEDAWKFERAKGKIFDFDNLSEAMQAGVLCMENTAPLLGGTTNRESGYRPPGYQQHLREVWFKNIEVDEKFPKLSESQKMACAPLRTTVKNEMSMHDIKFRPAKNSCHQQKPACAFDMSVWMSSNLLVDARIDLAAYVCSLKRFDILNDPTHFDGR